jgi:CrcB protein
MIVLVGAGSFSGGVMRYLLSYFLIRKTGGGTFPVWTFTVNLLGCLLIGGLYSASRKMNFSPAIIQFFGAGLLGGFTTFSAFSYETFFLLQQNQTVIAVVYAVTSVLLGLALTALGYQLTQYLL